MNSRLGARVLNGSTTAAESKRNRETKSHARLDSPGFVISRSPVQSSGGEQRSVFWLVCRNSGISRESCRLLGSKTPVAITRHGSTIGIYVPTKPKPSGPGSPARSWWEDAGVDCSGGNYRRSAYGRLQANPARAADAEGLAMLVLDANILICAVLGSRVLVLLRRSNL